MILILSFNVMNVKTGKRFFFELSFSGRRYIMQKNIQPNKEKIKILERQR
jgi:hypothetical protein